MTLDEYKAALKKHDWLYAFSDDHREWKRGQAQRDALNMAQMALDPDREIWNSLCHPMYATNQEA